MCTRTREERGRCLWWVVVLLRGYNHAPLRSLIKVECSVLDASVPPTAAPRVRPSGSAGVALRPHTHTERVVFLLEHLEHLECGDQPHIQGRGAKKRTQRAGCMYVER